MKRMIMLFVVVAGLALSNQASAQSKGVQSNTGDLRMDTNMPRERQENRLQQREARDPNGAPGRTMSQDTTRPRRDTMRSPQPVPPVPPVPMPSDTNRRR